jgi:hypothetical protein
VYCFIFLPSRPSFSAAWWHRAHDFSIWRHGLASGEERVHTKYFV